LFDELKSIEFPSILDQLRTRFPPRVKMDTLLLQVMGYSSDEINSLLDYLYPAPANEIEKLKTLMEG